MQNLNPLAWVGGLVVGVSGIANSIVNAFNAHKSRKIQEKAEETRLALQKAHQSSNLQLQRELAEQQRSLQLEMMLGNRETQLTVAREQRETAKQMEWYRKKVDNWPLRLVPEDIIDAHPNRQPTPLQVILAPPEIDYDRFGSSQEFPKLEKRLAQKMRTLLDRYFPFQGDDRPVELLDRAWDSNRFGGGSSVKTLFNQLKSESVLLLESEISGEELNLRLAYWSAGANSYSYVTAIEALPYVEMLDAFARRRVQQWKTDVYDKRLARGATPDELRARYPRQMAGLAVFLEEQEDLADGIPFDRHYPFMPEDDSQFCDFFASLHCLLSATFSDLHYLVLENREPLLPKMLPEILPGLVTIAPVQELLGWVVTAYDEIFRGLAADRDLWLADLRLALAEGLLSLADPLLAIDDPLDWVNRQTQESVAIWLTSRGAEVDPDWSQRCRALEELATQADLPYLLRLNQMLVQLGLRQVDLSLVEQQVPAALPAADQGHLAGRQDWYSKTYNYSVITLNQWGTVAKREEGSNQGFIETSCGLDLEFVRIPAGSFMMGSLKSEETRDDYERSHSSSWIMFTANEATRQISESPAHRVLLPEYFMSRTTVTQAQWAAVANLDPISLDLITSPSRFKNPNHPVESVTWEECIEFCLRLSKATGKAYRLPSEAEWEYACRAETTTPFHFGATLSTEVANYAGNYTYGNGQTGNYLQQTIPVGKLNAPNAWGLYDMHGNVREWCMDDWHGNYQGAPEDGSAWLKNNYDYSEFENHEEYFKVLLNSRNSMKLLRGGSWENNPECCRSAYRDLMFGSRDSNVGFRLACPRT